MPTPIASAPPNAHASSWRHRLVHPLLLIAAAALCAGVIVAGLELERMIVPIFFGLIVVLCGLERVLPYRRDWQPTGKEIGRDTAYLAQGIVFGGLAQALTGAVAIALAPDDNDLPLWLAAPIAVVLTDLCTYGFHRFVHVNRWMWREHGIHHVTHKVNTLNANTAHFLDIALNNIAAFGPLLLLGFSAPAVFIASMARTVQTFVAHANIDARLGPLGWVIMGPEHHRLHHSVDPAHAGNYGTILTLWDRVFGTFRWTPHHAEEVGVHGDDAFPPPERILACARHPFVQHGEHASPR